jgi:hypothetical protein
LISRFICCRRSLLAEEDEEEEEEKGGEGVQWVKMERRRDR